MAPVVFDTNILIDVLKGYEQVLAELAYWDERYMSAMTWMEVLAGTDASQPQPPIFRQSGLSSRQFTSST